MAVTLTADRAERLLRQWTQASTAPGLTTAEIEDLLWSARIADASANDPDAVLWTPTYGVSDLRQAAADGWMLKAGKLTTEYDVAADNPASSYYGFYDFERGGINLPYGIAVGSHDQSPNGDALASTSNVASSALTNQGRGLPQLPQ